MRSQAAYLDPVPGFAFGVRALPSLPLSIQTLLCRLEAQQGLGETPPNPFLPIPDYFPDREKQPAFKVPKGRPICCLLILQHSFHFLSRSVRSKELVLLLMPEKPVILQAPPCHQWCRAWPASHLVFPKLSAFFKNRKIATVCGAFCLFLSGFLSR